MNLKKSLIVGAFFLGGSFLSACGDDSPKKVSINGSDYTVSSDEIVQTKSAFMEDGIAKIGLVSDIEGAVENARISAEKLERENVDAVIIAGDVYENEIIRRNPLYPNSTNNVDEMVEGITPYAELDVPVFVIPGNHEERSVYNEGIKSLRKTYTNVFDINKKSVDLQGFNIVGMGGYHDQGFMPIDGFFLSDLDTVNAFSKLGDFQSQKEPTIFVTHGPPKSRIKIDYVKGFGHVGDIQIKSILNSGLEKIINVHGHIHEGGGNSDDSYKSGISINVASITDYVRNGSNTGLMSIDENKNVLYKAVK